VCFCVTASGFLPGTGDDRADAAAEDGVAGHARIGARDGAALGLGLARLHAGDEVRREFIGGAARAIRAVTRVLDDCLIQEG
jgi:hypothetical protein